MTYPSEPSFSQFATASNGPPKPARTARPFVRRWTSNLGSASQSPTEYLRNSTDVAGDIIVANAYVNPAIPKPADIDVNLAVVHFLKFLIQTHALIFRIKSNGEHKANLLKSDYMASRPDPEVILSRGELEDLRQHLAKLSTSGLEGEYQRVHQDCRLEASRFPQPAAIQQLVTLWRLLREIRKTEPIETLSPVSPEFAVRAAAPIMASSGPKANRRLRRRRT